MARSTNKRTTVKEQILDWFERNPGAKARSGPLAKALKIGLSTVADALAKMAAEGILSRAKATQDHGEPGSRKEQWEYTIPAPETVAQRREPAPFKPLSPAPQAYRRSSPVLDKAPSIINGPVHAPALPPPQPEVGQNTGSLESEITSVSALPEVQAGHDTPAADDVAASAAGDAESAAPEYHPDEVCFDPVKRAAALQERAERAEADLASVLSASRKFCEWLACAIPASPYPLNLFECQQAIEQHLAQLDARLVELTQTANEARGRADDLDKALDQTMVERDAYHAKADQLAAAIAEYFGADIGEHSSGNCPWDEALNIITESDTGKLYSPTLESKTPEAYAVVAPKKPIQRFTARHNADQAATIAARMVGRAEIFAMHRIAQASRGAVVIREA